MLSLISCRSGIFRRRERRQINNETPPMAYGFWSSGIGSAMCNSWRYRLGVALSIDIPYLRALFIALFLMVQVVASLLFFCLFVFSSFLSFSLLFIGKFFSFGRRDLGCFAPILGRLLLLLLSKKKRLPRGASLLFWVF